MAEEDPFAPIERRRRLFLYEWEVAVHAADRDRLHFNRGAIDFALAAIRVAGIINGGALVVFPAYVALFKVDIASVWRPMLAGGTCFTAGLLFSWLAAAVAYFALVKQFATATHVREANAQGLHRSYYPPMPNGQSDPSEAPDFKKLVTSSHTVSEILRWAGIVLSFLSFFAFIGGVVFAGLVLLPASIRPLF